MSGYIGRLLSMTTALGVYIVGCVHVYVERDTALIYWCLTKFTEVVVTCQAALWEHYLKGGGVLVLCFIE